MAPCKQVAFKPSLAEVLAQPFHDAAVRTQFIVDRNNLGHRAPFRCLKDGVQAIGIRFVGTEHAEVCQVHSEDVAEEISQFARRLGQNLTGARDFKCIICEVRQREGDQLASTIYVWVSSHAPVAYRRESRELVEELSVFVEQFFDLVTLHPGFKNLEMLWIFTDRCKWNLMRAECAFNGYSVHFLRAGPSLGCGKDDHGPDGLHLEAVLARLLLNCPDL